MSQAGAAIKRTCGEEARDAADMGDGEPTMGCHSVELRDEMEGVPMHRSELQSRRTFGKLMFQIKTL